MKKIAVFVPASFPASGNQLDSYNVVGADALETNAPILAEVRGMAAAGSMAIGADLFARMPKLEIVAKFGVGYDNVDVDAARAANVVVTNTPDVLTDEVADLAIGLLIATVRQIPQADRFLREGKWPSGSFPLSRSLRGRRVGILGLGRIGHAIARRVVAMGLDVAYCTRTARQGVPYAYYDTPLALARACDVMIVVVPGGPATDGLVGADVIEALGPDGVLINVARGSVVDEQALVRALADGHLGAAGLDVFTDEPNVPAALMALQNAVLLPHIGSGTGATRDAMGDLVLANLESWFAGRGPLTPVD
ncbi:2-hydroxyacid dehydrogenase [Roseinatronobacter sp. S2]|uniref:2-hydroxyacid dehydrogenase n=1 Tax=Roseinatronobacter sp. S2 TaxID=3035471 RepID=UPI00240F6B57|nr:2-hydroxyacid dehydrogenase [Roseinatronobacter sp. S2]WFE74927.1 2-hydroxyacid dehydrogenase [Roseinatronobacter sp. S2]